MITAALVLEDPINIAELKSYLDAGGKFVVLAASLPQGPLPVEFPPDVLIADLRWGGGVNLLRGKHPRSEGHWTQYGGLRTGLAQNLVISHAVDDKTKIFDAKSEPHTLQQAPYGGDLASDEYKHQHNHYQNVLVETFNFARDLNAVSIWGDCGAFAPGAKSWGGFFSARSWPVRWNGYTPPELNYTDDQLDAQLIGVEIDVLNAGKPWPDTAEGLHRPMAKVGLQIVGFGATNTAAVEIRTEDSDDPSRTPVDRRGAWHWGIILRNALGAESTVLMSENGRIRRGIDFDKTTFSEGAIRLSAAGPGSGVVFDGGEGGEIYTQETPSGLQLVIRFGKGGLKILDGVGNVAASFPG